MKSSNISHLPHDSLGGNYFKQSDLVAMRYLLTEGASHRDLADSPELPAVADGENRLSTLFIDKAEMRGRGWLLGS